MANMRPADTAASKTKQAFALRFPIAVRTCVPYVPFLPLRNAHFASRCLLSCCVACRFWAYCSVLNKLTLSKSQRSKNLCLITMNQRKYCYYISM